MTNPIEIQTDILSEIVGFIYASLPSDFEEANCIFGYFAETDGSWSVDTAFSYIQNGLKVGAYLNDQSGQVPRLVAKLHNAVQEHTGGRWKDFSLSFKKGGSPNAKFQYE